jgi:hypothetical protein
VGYVFFDKRHFALIPFLGYGVSKQHFPVTDVSGAFAGLNSSYDGKWFGPFVRVDGGWRLGSGWQLDFVVQYDQVMYRGVADWNLIAEFAHPVSFRHRADGYGLTGAAGVSYAMGRHLMFSLKGGYFNWETGTGIDELYLASGSVSRTRLNEVVRTGIGATLRVAWKL